MQHLAEIAVRSPDEPTVLGDVITAGEQLQITPAITEWFRRTGCVLHNHYGPTEIHVITAHTLTGTADHWPALPPIGRPIAHSQVYILDPSGQPVPIGVAGELYLGGTALARGYLRRPQLTATRFVVNPFDAGRLYRTGDLARYLPDGNIEFLGRIDNQVKVRGYRMELGEIETVLSQHPAVREAVAVTPTDPAGHKRLVAYLLPSEPETPQLMVNLRAYLQQKLPDYMIPTAFVCLDTLPLKPSGKVDRRALMALDTGRPTLDETYVSPDTDLEIEIATIWQDVLGLEKVGIRDNFFDIGGQSLSVVHVHTKLQELTAQPLSLTDLFHYPTIALLAQHLSRTMPEQRPSQPHQDRAPRPAGERSNGGRDEEIDHEALWLFGSIFRGYAQALAVHRAW